jgi:ABC-type transporter Mla subunit MlaD
MKCETINTILTYVLGVLALLGVIFALQTIFRTREFRTLQIQATVDNANLMRIQALANEAYAYSQKNPNPELTRIFQSAQATAAQPKPATR